jgi:hypothetical protein
MPAHETGMLTAQQMGYHQNSSWDDNISSWDDSISSWDDSISSWDTSSKTN